MCHYHSDNMFIIFELRKDFFKNINVQEEKWKEKQKLEKLEGKVDKFSYIQGLQHLTAIEHLTGKTKRYMSYKRIYTYN